MRNAQKKDWRTAGNKIAVPPEDYSKKEFSCTTFLPILDMDNMLFSDDKKLVKYPIKFEQCDKSFLSPKDQLLHFITQHCDIIYFYVSVKNEAIFTKLVAEFPNLPTQGDKKTLVSIPHLKCRSCLESYRLAIFGKYIYVFLIDPITPEMVKNFVDELWADKAFGNFKDKFSVFMRHDCTNNREPKILSKGQQHKFDGDHCKICLYQFPSHADYLVHPDCMYNADNHYSMVRSLADYLGAPIPQFNIRITFNDVAIPPKSAKNDEGKGSNDEDGKKRPKKAKKVKPRKKESPKKMT